MQNTMAPAQKEFAYNEHAAVLNKSVSIKITKMQYQKGWLQRAPAYNWCFSHLLACCKRDQL